MKSQREESISLKWVVVILMSFVFYMSCGDTSQPGNNSSDKIIDISEVRTHLPEIDGYEEFKKHCITCHSLRYIEMQPEFPEKTWDHIVHKMVKNFGAPIPDSSIAIIVKYLVKVKSGEQG